MCDLGFGRGQQCGPAIALRMCGDCVRRPMSPGREVGRTGAVRVCFSAFGRVALEEFQRRVREAIGQRNAQHFVVFVGI